MSKNVKISGKVLAIQLGREETQLILLSGAEVLYSTVLTTPVGAVEDGVIRNPDAVRGMLKLALKEPELKRVRKVVFSLITSQVISELVTTPNLATAKLEKLIQANADMYFPVDVKDYQLVWQPIGPKVTESGLEELMVQLWAVPNAMLSMYYTVANDCGLSVVAIDYCGHSIATAVGASFAKPGKAAKKQRKLDLNMEISFGKKKHVQEEEEDLSEVRGNAHTDMHILLEKDILGMTCVQNGQVVFQRFIRCGGDPSYQLGELAMMVEYFRALDAGRGSSIVGILSGALAEDRTLAAELADIMSISLGLLDFPYDLQWVCCIGAVNTNLDFGIPSLNKPSKAMQEMRSNLWQYALILVGGLMLISSVFSLLTARLNWSSDLSIRQTSLLALQAESKKYEGYADNYDAYIAAYNAYSSDWDNVFASLQTYNDNLVLVMDELEEILPEKSTVTDMQIGATGLNVTFACENKEQAAYIIMALREMQYADLLAVSSLSGGGAGPATTYGSGKTGEKAPVEGGSDISSTDRARLAASLDSDMDPFAVGYYMGLGENTPDLLETLAGIYGVTPENNYAVLEDVPATIQQRSDALYAMCMNNPFAMRAAEDMLYDHYMSGGELSTYVPQSSFASSWYSHRSVRDLQGDLTKTLNQFYLNETYTMDELMPVLERVIKENPDAELWYIYYLEGELAGTNPRPYLDMDVMVDDLADGTFDSWDANVNTILTNLLSTDTKTILEEITAEPECSHIVTHVQAVAPTCNADGHSEYWYCQTCQSMWTDEALSQPTTADAVKLPAAHTALQNVEAKEPTATEDGWYAHWYCADCGGYWMDADLKVPTTLEAITRPAECTHSMEHIASVEPTCDKAGNVEYWYCTVCETYWLDAAGTSSTTLEATVLAPEHKRVISVDYKAPTETESGNYAYWHCSDCGGYWLDEGLTQPTDSNGIVIEPNGCKHSLKHIEPIEPTCDKAGNVEYWFCGKCTNAWLDEAMTQLTTPAGTVLPASHKDVIHMDYLAPTATEPGNLEYWYCVGCSACWLDEALTKPTDLAGVTLPAAGCEHSLVHEAPVEPDCDTPGNLEYWACETCGLIWLDEAMTQPVDKEAVELPAAGHSITHVPAVEPTETEDGNLEYWYCETCQSYWLDEALTQSTDANGVIDPATGTQNPENPMMEQLTQILVTYMETGKTGLTPEQENIADMLLQQYMPDKTVVQVMEEQLTNYFSYGESDYPEFDAAIEDYLAENPEMEETLRQKYEKDVSIELALKEFLSTGDTHAENKSAIQMYLRTGDSGDEEYNQRLDTYVSEGKVDEELKALLAKGSEELNNTFKTVLENYKNDTGNAVINAQLEKIEKGSEDEEASSIEKALKEFLAEGKSNYEQSLIIQYITEGACSVAEYNEELDKFVSDGNVDGELIAWLVTAREDIKNETIVKMLENYEKDTGNAVINAQLKKCEDSLEATVQEAVKYLKTYLANGSADPRYDGIIKTFLVNGTFENEKMNKVFENYIKAGNVDNELTSLIYLYVYQNNVLQTSQYKDSGILQMLNNYHNRDNGTGSLELNNRIKYCYSAMLADYIQQLNASKKDSSSSKGSGKPKEIPDTRTFFTVVLAYNDDLRNAELERKGLDYEEKIPLIEEVGEE